MNNTITSNYSKLKYFFALITVLAFHMSNAAVPSTLPENLMWQTNNTDPEFASEDAVRGGLYRIFIKSFPLTLRQAGPDSNGLFARYIWGNQLSLVSTHPNTLRPIPSLATHWAFDEDQRTIYFKLDPKAQWSDGTPVTADDYVYTHNFALSKHIKAPYTNNYHKDVIVDVVKYDNHTVSVVSATSKPKDELLRQSSIKPTPQHFHILDENWVKNYNWKVEPNTGPYQICEVRKGQYIIFCRNQNWWANDLRYQRHRFNPDMVKIKILRNTNIAYQYFIKGDLDTFSLRQPYLWHKKAKGEKYDIGHIGKIKFYNELPRVSRGFYLNTDDPLFKDINVRLGFSHALNVDEALRAFTRGDYERLQTMSEGYGVYSNNSIKARKFDINKANIFLNRAGWTTFGEDGIRQKNGERLSVRITYYNNADSTILSFITEEAKKAGVELKLSLLDGATAVKQISEKKHQAAWMGWSYHGIAPLYWTSFHSDNAHKPQTTNVTNTDDAELDTMIEEYRASTLKVDRINFAHAIEERIHELGVFVPAYKIPYTRVAFWRWVKLPDSYGTQRSSALFNPFGDAGGLFWLDLELREKMTKNFFEDVSFDPLLIIDETWKNEP